MHGCDTGQERSVKGGGTRAHPGTPSAISSGSSAARRRQRQPRCRTPPARWQSALMSTPLPSLYTWGRAAGGTEAATSSWEAHRRQQVQFLLQTFAVRASIYSKLAAAATHVGLGKGVDRQVVEPAPGDVEPGDRGREAPRLDTPPMHPRSAGAGGCQDCMPHQSSSLGDQDVGCIADPQRVVAVDAGAVLA